MPTHWQQTNGIMQRNRRIGTSLTGIAAFADEHGLPVIREWMDEGYNTIRKYDHSYSEWLCVRESVRVTTVKPSGSVSLAFWRYAWSSLGTWRRILPSCYSFW
jgi:ribonucleoside-triphosphate reductase (thioredoxin)